MAARTVLDCVNAVKSGSFPEVPELKEERIIVLHSQLLANFSLILAHCLLNSIPADDNSEDAFALRSGMFDEIMATINLYNYGRTNKMVDELNGICSKYEDKTVMWPSKKERNNIILFITQYIMWDDNIRAVFFGAETEQPEPEKSDNAPEEVVEVEEQ